MITLLNRKISKNYAVEFVAFHKIREFKDGWTFFTFDVNLELYKADHNPRFRAIFVLFNFTIFEFGIYNVHHVDEQELDVL